MNPYIVTLPPDWRDRYPLLIRDIEDFLFDQDTAFIGEMYKMYDAYVNDEEYQYNREEYEQKLSSKKHPIYKSDIAWYLNEWDINYQRMQLLSEFKMLNKLPKLALSAVDKNITEDTETLYHDALEEKQGINAEPCP